MSTNSSETFGTYFKTLRLKAGISTLKKFGDLLASQGFSYEDSIFSHWQSDRKLPIQRKVVLAILTIFKETYPNLTIEESNNLLLLAGHGYLTDQEKTDFSFSSPSSPFLAPPRISYFFGRELEISQVYNEIQNYKIIQISGQAGIGKTALAIELAHRMLPIFSDGILWYRLDTTDITSILNYIAKAFGENIDDIKDLQLKSAFINSLLRDKNVLIIFDNFEQINSREIHYLIFESPNVKYLFSTQQAYIHIDPPPYNLKLSSFNDDDVKRLYEKVVLSKDSKNFLFFCNYYGNLPLIATSLARRIKYLKANNLPHTSIKNTLNDSEELFNYEDKNLYQFFDKTRQIITPTEDNVWISTAVFSSKDFSEEAVQYINNLSANEAHRILQKLYSLSLIEKSDNNRWRIHPAIKNYLSSYLDNKVFSLLVNFYASIFYRDSNGYNNLYPKMEKDFDELRSLMSYCLKNNMFEDAVKLWDSLSIYLWERGYWYLLRDFGEQILKLTESKNEKSIYATVIIRDLAWLYIWQGELLKTYKLLNDRKLQAIAATSPLLLASLHQLLGFIFAQRKIPIKALKYLESSQKIFSLIGDKNKSNKSLLYIGHVYEKTKDLDQALNWYKKSLSQAKKYNFIETTSKSHYYIGEIYKKQKDYQQAKEHFNIALEIDNNIKRRAGIGWNKQSLAEIAHIEGHNELGRKLHQEADEAFLIVGVSPSLG